MSPIGTSVDRYPERSAGNPGRIDGPGRRQLAVTKDDNVDLPFVARWLYTGSGGTLKLVCLDDPDSAGVAYANVPAGAWWYLAVVRVFAAGSSATGIVVTD